MSESASGRLINRISDVGGRTWEIGFNQTSDIGRQISAREKSKKDVPPAALDGRQTPAGTVKILWTADFAVQRLAFRSAEVLDGRKAMTLFLLASRQEKIDRLLHVCLGQAQRAVKILPVHGSRITVHGIVHRSQFIQKQE